jgi:hypothetical protein
MVIEASPRHAPASISTGLEVLRVVEQLHQQTQRVRIRELRLLHDLARTLQVQGSQRPVREHPLFLACDIARQTRNRPPIS